MSERYSYDDLEGCIEGWRDSDAENPPTFEEIVEMEREFGERIPTRDEYEQLMLVALKLKKIGMDGFRYCWPEVQKQNWRSILRWKATH